MSEPQMQLKPPKKEVGVTGWIRKNLFSTWYNVLLTLLSISMIVIVTKGIISWVFKDANWSVISTNIKVFLIGRYPKEEAWRIIASLILLLILTIITMVFWKKGTGTFKKYAVICWLLSFPVIGIVLRGIAENSPVLRVVPTNIWSGLMLTLILAVVGILASFPIGVLLALGRRSQLPVIKIVCTIYIEIIRGIPLISVLFMSQLMIPLFLPPEIHLGTVTRALTGMTLFSAAYTAENIRGGLAAVPIGQYEAAQAVGLNKFLMMILIILPQALRNVIPTIVGQFISLFKDTTLVVIVGLLDLLGVAKAVTGQKEFIGLHMEAYTFVALLFFIFCFTMSRASRRLEKVLGVGER